MAKTKLNPTLQELSGRVGGIVFKNYAKGVVVSKTPNMSRVKATPAQRQQRDRMKWSGLFYRGILVDPALKEQYAAAANAAGMSLRNFATKEYMRRTRQPGADIFIHATPLRDPTPLRPVPRSPAPAPPLGPGMWCW